MKHTSSRQLKPITRPENLRGKKGREWKTKSSRMMVTNKLSTPTSEYLLWITLYLWVCEHWMREPRSWAHETWTSVCCWELFALKLSTMHHLCVYVRSVVSLYINCKALRNPQFSSNWHVYIVLFYTEIHYRELSAWNKHIQKLHLCHAHRLLGTSPLQTKTHN